MSTPGLSACCASGTVAQGHPAGHVEQINGLECYVSAPKDNSTHRSIVIISDIFGYTAERRMERALIGEYRQTVGGLLGKLNADNLSQAVAIASIPEDIRGYGHVKERHLRAAKSKEAALIAAFDAPAVNAA